MVQAGRAEAPSLLAVWNEQHAAVDRNGPTEEASASGHRLAILVQAASPRIQKNGKQPSREDDYRDANCEFQGIVTHNMIALLRRELAPEWTEKVAAFVQRRFRGADITGFGVRVHGAKLSAPK
jgi:hypothetical protein